MNADCQVYTKTLDQVGSLLHDRRQDAEIRLIRQLNWAPGLPEFIDHGFTPGGRRYVSYRRLPGKSLAERLTSINAESSDVWLKTADWRSFATGLLGRIAHLHQQTPPIFHGDISANNVLLSDNGTVGLIDFGISRSRALPFVLRLPSQMSIAAPRYLSPEQAQGKFWASASDVYQCGLVVMTLIRGKPINPTLTVKEMLERLRNNPSRIQEQAAEIDGAAGRFLARLLHPRPHQRPRAFEALAMLETKPYQTAVAPPSSGSATPVVNAASSEQR
ncbi:serine/threonine protein kinase [Marinobacter confluentis]|uniref:Protein kinase domain-containing protein n=1 Tax=Marinobacter confluentis TaxID=1697557 RepID=A0A4Z1C5S6_9GAMM|nr:protein kinase [Marinobacter confluentis]TGN41871.1 hypothetical protein E5Q11_04955 [Marinobacter confluentis]